MRTDQTERERERERECVAHSMTAQPWMRTDSNILNSRDSLQHQGLPESICRAYRLFDVGRVMTVILQSKHYHHDGSPRKTSAKSHRISDPEVFTATGIITTGSDRSTYDV